MKNILKFITIVFAFAFAADCVAQQNNPDTKIRLKLTTLKARADVNTPVIWQDPSVGQNGALPRIAPNMVLDCTVTGGGEGFGQRLDYADFIVIWDPSKFELVAHSPINDSRIDQSLSGLSPISVSKGLNDTFADGNAMFRVVKNASWTGDSAFQLTALTGSWLINDLGNALYNLKFRCIADQSFVGQTSFIGFADSIQVNDNDVAYSKIWGYTPTIDVTGTMIGRNIIGVPNINWKIKSEFTAPETTVNVGNQIEIPIIVSPEVLGLTQRLSSLEYVFTWDPSKLRFIDISFIGASPNVWIQQSGLPYCEVGQTSGCLDFNRINESIPPSDGNAYISILNTLGPKWYISEPTLVGKLIFEVISSFDATSIETIQETSHTNPTYTRLLGSESPGVTVHGTFIGASLIGGMITGDINADGLVDSQDLGILLSYWGQSSFNANPADLNNDGSINAADLSILMANWN